MKKVTVDDKTFRPFISYEKLSEAIDKVAGKINDDYRGCKDVPALVCVLNGAIMFTAELMKRLDFPVELISIKLSSYSGTRSTGKVRHVILHARERARVLEQALHLFLRAAVAEL